MIEFSDAEAQIALCDFIEDSKSIKRELLKSYMKADIPQCAIDSLNKLTGEQLTVLAYITNAYTSNRDPLRGQNYNMPIKATRSMAFDNPWVTCIGAAVGLVGISSVKDQILMKGIDAATGRTLVKFIGSHYLGWVSAAFMIYDGLSCLDSMGLL